MTCLMARPCQQPHATLARPCHQCHSPHARLPRSTPCLTSHSRRKRISYGGRLHAAINEVNPEPAPPASVNASTRQRQRSRPWQQAWSSGDTGLASERKTPGQGKLLQQDVHSRSVSPAGAAGSPETRQRRPARQPQAQGVTTSAAAPRNSASSTTAVTLHVQPVTTQRSDAHGSSTSAEAVQPRTLKQYAPVYKGHVALPGGPNWSKFRQHFTAPPDNADPSLPATKTIIVVEGDTDRMAVHRAVRAVVYVCAGSLVKSKAAAHELQALRQLGHDLLVLTDPDVHGRELRVFLDDALGPGIKHAFLPAAQATSTRANKRHEAGSIGVENAAPQAIRRCLVAAHPSFGPGRQEFTAHELIQLGLANTFDNKVSGARLRRELVCSALGLDSCTAGALVSSLNRFFTREQFERAVMSLPATASSN
mmetsp:Transcript_13734/g.29527  ORF Transcript_13734/g.29527 Transcript_13734/m.29527 type:complete len:423 (-) Transcript_13734:93-1361(-)